MAACLQLSILLTLVSASPTWTVWTTSDASSRPVETLAVGSLSKPFVVHAWAMSHPEEAPVIECTRSSGCWRPRGHGTVDLRRAIAVSCNSYFKRLASVARPEDLASALRRAGFVIDGPLTPDAAIGLAADGVPAVRITPRDLLSAYVRLVREPWATGESHRQLVLSGLRDAAAFGTAAAVRHRGLWAKTGTIRSPRGPSWRTAGLALVVDGAGWAGLGRLDPGTGRDAAQRMRAVVGSRTATGPATTPRVPTPRRARSVEVSIQTPARTNGDVRVRILGLLRPQRVTAVNVGAVPIATSTGFVGPRGTRELRPGDRLASGAWELRIDSLSSVRRIDGALEVAARPGAMDIVATVTRRAYVDGVVLAELGGSRSQRIALPAAGLRFLAEGPRHEGADVCDSTHCAWFQGSGPYIRWPAPRTPVTEGTPRPLTDGEWTQAQTLARSPGPSRWTSDCGGTPLSPHAVWGGGDRRVADHPTHAVKRWERTWNEADVRRVFGESVSGLSVRWTDGRWRLAVDGPSGRSELLSYDEAHERLAAVAGWGALPSPADRVHRMPGGYRVEGVGLGHRVGLCLRSR